MFLDILTPNQQSILPYLKVFKSQFYLVGGTAIALHLGHRRSIDFDLFSYKPIKSQSIRKKLKSLGLPFQPGYSDGDQLHGVVFDVKLTFYEYPYEIDTPHKIRQFLTMPSLIDLAAMKIYALGRRSKWKDFVDLYFILKDHYSLEEISSRALDLFSSAYNPKLIRQQLCYFEDVNYSEEVEYTDVAPTNAQIESFLTEVATRPF